MSKCFVKPPFVAILAAYVSISAADVEANGFAHSPLEKDFKFNDIGMKII